MVITYCPTHFQKYTKKKDSLDNDLEEVDFYLEIWQAWLNSDLSPLKNKDSSTTSKQY